MLPISRKHLNYYLAQQREYQQDLIYLPRDGKSEDQTATYKEKVSLDKTGNWRITNKVDKHNVYYLRANEPSKLIKDAEGTATIMGILFAVGIVLSIGLGIGAFVLNKKINEAGKGSSINEGG